MERVTKIDMTFYSSGGWETDDPRKVTGGDGADSMLRFRIEMGGDETER
jgi:hypothetical protein